MLHKKVKHVTGGPEMFVYNLNKHADGTTQLVYTRWWDGQVFQTYAFQANELVES